MFAIAVDAAWLANSAPQTKASVLEALARAAKVRRVVVVGAGASPLPEGVRSMPALPAAEAGTSLVLVGSDALVPGRGGVIPLVVGRECRDPGVAWAGTVKGVELLCGIGRDSGVEMALANAGAEEHAAGLRRRFAAHFDALRKHGAAYVFGAKRLGAMVGTSLNGLGYRVAAYLDNNPAAWGKHADGAPIQGVDDKLDRRLPVIIGTTRFPYTLTQQLKKAGFELIVPYPAMSLLDAAAFPDEIPYIGTYQDIGAHREKYLSEYLNYDDDRSRDILDALLCYRLTLDSSVVQTHFEPESEQYFDKDLARLTSSEVWVDAGGFDGQTTLNFMGRVGGKYGRVYYFEPDAALMERSRQVMKDRENVVFCEAGAFSRDGTTSFNTTGTTNGSINPAAGASGDITIAVRRIDDVLMEPATFIKMDIEGAEPEALKGAKEQIAKNAPRLAIAAYHKGEDIWQLAELIRDLNPSYRLGLRHYTEGGLETVIYANRPRSG